MDLWQPDRRRSFGSYQLMNQANYGQPGDVGPARVPSALQERSAQTHGCNYNVFYILPVTTFRTIDLGGKKNPDPLFSIFCAEMSDFLEGFSAPECVHNNQDSGIPKNFNDRSPAPWRRDSMRLRAMQFAAEYERHRACRWLR